MCHDYCHCQDYNPKECPNDCFRAQLAQDLEKHWHRYVSIPLTYAFLRGTGECPLNAISVNELKNIIKEKDNG